MKTSFASALLLSLLLGANLPASAQTATTDDNAAPPPASPSETPAAPRELTIEVVESLNRGSSGITTFDRISMVFTQVFEKRKWPVTIKTERFAANNPTSDLELRIFYQGISKEAPGELTFRAWMILYDHGAKRDFGIVKFRYDQRPAEPREDVLEHVVRGAAVMAANRIEDALFPKPDEPKP